MQLTEKARKQGSLWGIEARDWLEIQERKSPALWRPVLDLPRVGAGTRMLDAGCGAGGVRAGFGCGGAGGDDFAGADGGDYSGAGVGARGGGGDQARASHEEIGNCDCEYFGTRG